MRQGSLGISSGWPSAARCRTGSMHTAHPVQPQHVAARLATLVSALVPTPLPLVLTSPDPAQPCGPVKTQAGKVYITPKEGVQQAQVVESKEFKTVQVPPASNDEQLRAALEAVQVRCGYTLLLPCNSSIGLSICWLRLPGMRDPAAAAAWLASPLRQ